MSVYRNLLIFSVCICGLIASSAFAFQTREWGTYYGGKGFDQVYKVTTDPAGNFYVVGSTKSTSKIIPPSKIDLAHDSVLEAEMEAYVAKFNSAGVLQWATYYGDSYSRAADIGVDLYGSVYVLGAVQCPSTALATEYAEDKTCNGPSDLFLVKFNQDGVRDWSRYIGGDDREGFILNAGVESLAIVGYAAHPGYIYVHGSTRSKTGLIPQKIPSPDDTYGGKDDTFIAKFGPTGDMMWARYFGGNDHDMAGGIACRKNPLPGGNDVCYITGRTNSINDIATNGAWDTIKNSDNSYGYDAYLARLDANNGEVNWATYYGGDESDSGVDVTIDNDSNVYIAGDTASTDSMTHNASQPNYGGNNDMFLAKFNPNGVRLWGTYLGSSGDEFLFDLTTDNTGNVYISGTAYYDGNNKTVLATPGVYDGTLNGGSDAVLAKYNTVGTRLRTTYYGGSEGEYGPTTAVDSQNGIYLCGNTVSTSSISMFGAHQTLHGDGGGEYDGFCVKFLQ